MAKGTQAKELVQSKLQQAFGKDFIGVYDKKIYVWSMEDGEKVQVAISLTCPKSPVEVVASTAISNGGLDFENMGPAVAAPEKFVPAEITEEEKATVAELMARLGL